MKRILTAEFYQRDVRLVAKELLGKRLVSLHDQRLTSGLIVETEAYLHESDSASHAAKGPRPGNASMFGEAGKAYVYAIHARWCFNVVCQLPGQGCAVLIRAVEPMDGIATMMKRRQTENPWDLCRGPARLCQALAIDKQCDGRDLTTGTRLWIDQLEARAIDTDQIKSTQRIGVTSAKQLRLRFVVAGHTFASGPQRLR